MATKTQKALLTGLRALYPNPRPELSFTNPYETIIAVMLSAQSTDVQVNKVTPTLFQKDRKSTRLNSSHV